jgi:hypothetical protein
MRAVTVLAVLILGIAWVSRSQVKPSGMKVNGRGVSEIRCGSGLQCFPMGDAVQIETDIDYRLKPMCSFKAADGSGVIDTCDALQQKLWKGELK